MDVSNYQPNWAEIHELLDNCEVDVVGDVKKETLRKIATILEKNWSELQSLKSEPQSVLHLRPEQVKHWNLPCAVEVNGISIIVLGKGKPINDGTINMIRLGTDLNNLKPVISKTIRFEDTVLASADWIKNSTKNEVEMYKLVKGNPEFINVLQACEYKSKAKVGKDVVDKMSITMEYCNAGDLFNSDPEKIEGNIFNFFILIKDMCLILDKLHQLHILHRDIKPENLFLIEDENGMLRMKLGDFGFAGMINKEFERLHNTDEGVGGSKHFKSPEVFLGVKEKNSINATHQELMIQFMCSRKTDVWGMGIVLYTMIIGDLPPFAGKVELDKEPVENSRWKEMIDIVLDAKLVQDNCIGELGANDELREFVFKMIRQMLELDQTKRITGPELLKQFLEFEPIGIESLENSI